MNSTNKIILPIQVAHGFPLRIRQPGDMSGGHSHVECDSAEHAREVIAANPRAAMPCWKNPRAAWNEA